MPLTCRKTITGGDVVAAMGDMEFDKFVRPLENSLASKDHHHLHVTVLVSVTVTGDQCHGNPGH